VVQERANATPFSLMLIDVDDATIHGVAFSPLPA
jgi:hypothetical protein